MALNTREVVALQAQIDAALADPGVSGFERQFLAGQKARLDQHGTHAMITRDQRSRMDAIFARIEGGGAASSEPAEPSAGRVLRVHQGLPDNDA